MKKYEKGYLTVEYSLIMPLILACIFLVLIMNFYLHDQVVLNVFTTELVHSDMDTDQWISEFNDNAEKKTLLIQNISCYCEQSIGKTTLRWKKSLVLPIQNVLKQVLDQYKVELSGMDCATEWNMTELMRIKQIAQKGGA